MAETSNWNVTQEIRKMSKFNEYMEMAIKKIWSSWTK